MPTLHPQIVKVIEAMRRAGLKPIEALSPDEARRQMEETAKSRKAEPLPVGRVEDREIPGPAGPIRVRLYWPEAGGREAARTVPAIAYYHGGGHVIGSLDTHDLIARNLCHGAGALVVSVDYRMGPEHKFPAAVEDSFAALEWLHANAASLGADPERLGVHGDSAGGNLAAVVALIARDRGGPSAAAAIAGLPGRRLHAERAELRDLRRGIRAVDPRRDAMVSAPLSAQPGRRRGLARLADPGAEPRRGRAGDRRHRGMRRAAR